MKSIVTSLLLFLFSGALSASPHVNTQYSSSQFYDKFGELVTFIKTDGVTLHHEYSLKGLPTRLYSSDGSIDYYYYYDSHDNLTDAFDFIHQQNIHRVYNDEGVLIRETTHEDQNLDFDYNFENMLVEVTLPDHTSLLYSDDIIVRFGPLKETLYELHPNHQISTDVPLTDTFNQGIEFKSCGAPKTFKFDPLNRVVEFTVENKLKTTYCYDALHRKTCQKIYLWDAPTHQWIFSTTDYFLYHYDTEIAVLDDSKTLKLLRIYERFNGEAPETPRVIEVNGVLYTPMTENGDSYESPPHPPEAADQADEASLKSTIEGILLWFKMPDPNNPHVVGDVSTLRWILNHLMHWREVHTTGVIGRGELGDKVRITYINGMLNGSYEVLSYLTNLSELHGGANIYYVFRESNGFLKDVLKAGLIKTGYITDHAKALAHLWNQKIEEMGGVDSGGTIIHYSHSLGAADTYAASTLLTDSELKMIKVFTFGSPQIIPTGIFGEVHNYISRWDGVSPLGPTRYIKALLLDEPHVIFVRSNEGFPFQDHAICSNTYSKIMSDLAAKITETFGPLEE